MNDYFPYFDGVILNPLLILQTIVFENRKMPQVYGSTIHLRKSKEKRKKKKKYEDVYFIYLSFFSCRKEHESIGVKRHYIPKIPVYK